MNQQVFNVLRYFAENPGKITQRMISEEIGISPESVNEMVTQLIGEKQITEDYEITETGIEALKPFEVENAIILAAGMSTRFAPFSYEKPKGLTVVKGEVLIERQIIQLQTAGVKEIIVVLGHMMEKFLYLMDQYGVKVVINNEYRYKNTHSSIYFARDYLKNTYICCADNYYTKNVFHKYEYHALYSTLYMSGIWRGERGVFCEEDGLIINTRRPAVDQWGMNGYAYFDREFSRNFGPILEEIYNKPGTNDLYWEQVYAEHIDRLHLYEVRYTDDVILEFDSLSELEAFDPEYIKYNDLQLLRNICSALRCSAADIYGIKPVAKGFTNKSFRFCCRGKKYIYRVPGRPFSEFIDRRIEKGALETAKRIGIDTSYIYQDEAAGWKIAGYIESTEVFDFSNEKHLKLLCDIFHKLYDHNLTCGRIFDHLYEAKRLLEKLRLMDEETYDAAAGLLGKIEKTDREVKGDGWPIQMIHNDVYEDNLLVSGEQLYLIDWEYAGDADKGVDLCKLFVKNEATGEDIERYLSLYFGRKPDCEECRHIVGCAVVSFYYWYVWALYMVKKGNDYADLAFKYLTITNRYINEYENRKS